MVPEQMECATIKEGSSVLASRTMPLLVFVGKRLSLRAETGLRACDLNLINNLNDAENSQLPRNLHRE